MATRLDAVQCRPFAVEQNRVDITWERVQEQAMQAYKARNNAGARASWAKGLDIAERHFERGDPRLAASLNNYAFALMRQGQVHQANFYFRRSIVAWEESWCWVPWMAPSTAPGDDESTPYDQTTQGAFYAMIKQGRAITETLMRERRLPEMASDDWNTVKPKRMNDVRRLFSAIFLMPTSSPQ
ncbi:MAG: hypothetical protein ACR2RE_11185 [Geminicoccaceae bacterium]